MKYSFTTIFSWLIAAVIVTASSNLFYVLNENVGYVNGMRVDYLMPKFYISDIFIILAILAGLTRIDIRKEAKNIFSNHRFLVVALIVIGCYSIIFSKHQLAALMGSIKIIEFGLFAAVFWLNKKYLNRSIILTGIYLTLILQTGTAILQFIQQTAITPYRWFGETQFTGSTIGIARATLFGQEKILSYGFTAHPNILAGTTVLLSILILHLSTKKNIFIIINAILIIFLTQSFSALLALLIGICCYFFQANINKNETLKKIILISAGLLFFLVPAITWIATWFTDSFSVFRRHELNASAMQMIWQSPFLGVGLNNFTANLEKFLSNRELVRFIQPAHHVGVLWLAETGILGLAVLIRVAVLLKQNVLKLSPLLVTLLPLISLDHFISTIQTGIVTGTIFVLISQYSPNNSTT